MSGFLVASSSQALLPHRWLCVPFSVMCLSYFARVLVFSSRDLCPSFQISDICDSNRVVAFSSVDLCASFHEFEHMLFVPLHESCIVCFSWSISLLAVYDILVIPVSSSARPYAGNLR